MTAKKASLWVRNKNLKKYFFTFFFCFSFENSRRTNVVLINIFFNVLKKVNNRQKQPKWRFWQLIVFFIAFSKILTKRTFAHLLFLKLNQSETRRKKFWGGFSAKTKNALFRGSEIVVLKTILKFWFGFSAFVLLCKRRHHADFHKKNINI